MILTLAEWLGYACSLLDHPFWLCQQVLPSVFQWHLRRESRAVMRAIIKARYDR